MNAQHARDILNNPLWLEYHEHRLEELRVRGMDLAIPADESLKARMLYHALVEERQKYLFILRNEADKPA